MVDKTEEIQSDSASEGEDTPDNQGEQEKAIIFFMALDEVECSNTKEMEASADEVESLFSI